MMILTEGSHAGEALVAELPGQMSRDTVTIVSGQVLEANSILGKITSGGKYAIYDNAASDGTETAVAVLLYAVDATGGDKTATVITQFAVFNAGEVVWKSGADGTAKTAGTADLKTKSIFLR